MHQIRRLFELFVLLLTLNANRVWITHTHLKPMSPILFLKEHLTRENTCTCLHSLLRRGSVWSGLIHTWAAGVWAPHLELERPLINVLSPWLRGRWSNSCRKSDMARLPSYGFQSSSTDFYSIFQKVFWDGKIKLILKVLQWHLCRRSHSSDEIWTQASWVSSILLSSHHTPCWMKTQRWQSPVCLIKILMNSTKLFKFSCWIQPKLSMLS